MSEIFGILNLGNTCYINVNIQMILNCTELNTKLLEKFDNVNTRELLYSYLCILKRLKEIKEEQKVEKKSLDENDKICIRKLRLTSFIEKFRRIFSQVSFNQQDCLEGLTFILDNFHNGLIQKGDDYSLIMNNVRYNNAIMNSCIKQFKNDIEKDHTLLFNLFYSYMSNSIKCTNCDHTIHKIEKYKEISVDLENKENNNLLNTPKYLIVQLKRFLFQQETMSYGKIMTPVEYPLFLDLDNYLIEDNINDNINNKTIYKLNTIINHLGRNFNGGHYTSFHNIQEQWATSISILIGTCFFAYFIGTLTTLISY